PLAFGRSDQSLSDVEVVLTTRINELNGTVVNGDRRAAAGATVIVFGVDRDRWYADSRFVRKASAGQDGRFAIAGLPAGAYYAAAVTALPPDGPDAWRDPEYLINLVPRAETVTFGNGETRTISVIARQ